ncbi:MAG: carbohydrate ABC transporter permease [Bacillota bacterium]
MAKKLNVEKELWQISAPLNILLNIIIISIALSCFLPFLLVVIVSFTSEQALVQNGYSFLPKALSLEAYRYTIFSSDQLIRSYLVTIGITVIGVILVIIMTLLYAYPLTRPEFRYRRLFNLLMVFPMLFAVPLVPFYIVMTKFLMLKNNIFAMIIPGICGAGGIFFMRVMLRMQISDSLIEAARIDGCGEIRTLFRIVVPLMKPAIAVTALGASLGYWNEWFNAMLFIDSPNLLPLQYMLMKIQNSMEFILKNSAQMGGTRMMELMANLPQEGVRMAMIVLATGPAVLAYPFFQRYFISGLSLGAVKE